MTFNCCTLSLEQRVLMGTVKILPLVFSAIKFNTWCWAGINQWSQSLIHGGSSPLFYIKSSQSALSNNPKHAVWNLEWEWHLLGRRVGGHHCWLRLAGPGTNENWQITPQEKKNLTKITTMQINVIHKGGEDLCGCFPHPFHLASFFCAAP